MGHCVTSLPFQAVTWAAAAGQSTGDVIIIIFCGNVISECFYATADEPGSDDITRHGLRPTVPFCLALCSVTARCVVTVPTAHFLID